MYIANHPEILDDVSNPGLYLDAVSEIPLAIRLNEVKLLPEEKRTLLVQNIITYTIKGQDFNSLNDKRIQSVFKEKEIEQLYKEIEHEFIPQMDDYLHQWEFDWSSDFNAEEFMEPLISGLKEIKNNFINREEISAKIDSGILRIKDWISEHEDETEDEDEMPARKKFDDTEVLETFNEVRSIFDDVDSTE